MQRQLFAFAGDYDAEADRWIDDQEGQFSIHNPLLFVFIGDKSLDALNAVYDMGQKKWHNGKGVLYVHFYTDKTVSREKENVFSLQLSAPVADRRKIRKDLHGKFYEDTRRLVELNRAVRQVSNRIAEYGSMYSSFQRLNIAVATRADDPCNVLLPEIVLLLRTVLSESFKLIQTDLYGLIQEKQGEEEHAYSASMGISFLNELELYQSRSYSFNAMLLVTEDQMSLPAVHGPAPLFDLVYLLSDKNEQGIFPDASMETNYEIICNMSLLKNRKIVDDFDHRQEPYNNQHFRQHINPAEAKGSIYSTAGFSKIKRPNQAIALTVIYYFYQSFLAKLSEQSKTDKRSIAQLLQLDSDALDRKVSGLLPRQEKLEEMNALLSDYISFDELKKLNLGQAEEQMYGRHADVFFDEHFARAAASRLHEYDCESELREIMDRRIVDNPTYGLYCAYAWTSEREDAVIFQELRSMIRDTAKLLEDARSQLQQLRQESVEQQSFQRIPFMNKANVKKFSRHFFQQVYGQKMDILFYETKLNLLKRYENAVEKLHMSLKAKVDRLHELEKLMKDACRQSVSEANDYLGRNIAEYYRTVVTEIIQDIQAKRGENFYFDERYIGNVVPLIASGVEPLLRRLMEVCRQEIFTYPQFRQSFEDELLQRANVTVRFEDKDHVLSKEELYRDLNQRLEDQATVHIDVYNYTHKHRYEEKYFFADFDSEFIRYAFAIDKGSRMYKLGCVHEKKNSGIEKLNIMGGFQLEDLMYYRNGKKYYETYKEGGFEFHPEPV
ncbi:hypothetical protein [Paenibacillus eucommiae]|uniref:ElaB/YqjD/DUF883 family membrane-anchored ribosome-binding protein n=1 Tax=Paenibacillus eucommiae TaxID=1355755 RepID=A0ABS4J038_9BACL|nr:hypothetical protein [Paenibacillus eucommiae]MBP1992471.1 ElaB/YqjD/DUF883 family membrane-anchored ribosome-binding protein [Paenibacillus eucommiae]